MRKDTGATRRQLLTTTAGALAGVGLAGTASADTRAVASFDGTDVHGSCDGSKIGEVSSDAQGDVTSTCTDSSGREWYYVNWDQESPNGWAVQGDVLLYK